MTMSWCRLWQVAPWIALLPFLVLGGCSSTAPRDRLIQPLAESYFLPDPAGRIWEAALAASSGSDRRVLVTDDRAHLLTWMGEIERDEDLHSSLTDPIVASRRARTIGVTMLRVEEVPGGSRLTLRQVYFPQRSAVGISSSRGSYEQELLRRIRKVLTSGVTSHADN
jgi:hypothetical protein